MPVQCHRKPSDARHSKAHPLPRAALLLILALQAKFSVPLEDQGVPLLAEVEVLWLHR